jgi:hypothetical protein
MEFARVHHGTPEQVFVTVRNSDSTTMSVGYGVIWDLPFISSGSAGGGYEGLAVTFANTTSSATYAPNPGLFAGVVAPSSIDPGAYGRVQVFGLIDSVVLHGHTGAPFNGWAGYTSAGAVSRLILQPYHLFGWNTVVTQPGILGVLNMGTTADTTLRPFVHGGYVVPYSDAYTSVSTDSSWILESGGVGTTATAWCKAFIRCL